MLCKQKQHVNNKTVIKQNKSSLYNTEIF